MQSWAVAEADLRTKYKSVMDADELAAQARLAASEAVVRQSGIYMTLGVVGSYQMLSANLERLVLGCIEADFWK